MKNKLIFSLLSLTALIVIALGVSILMATSARAANTAYYVDCSAATNGNGTQASPWNTLASANALTYGPGDQILLKRGATCTGQQLAPAGGAGVSGNPIIIDAYGTGNKPIIATNGVFEDSVKIYNMQYIEVRNLELTNNASKGATRAGVHVVLNDYGTGNYYRITGMTIHNVKGDLTNKETGGIIFHVTGTVTQTKFNDVVIDGNTVYTVDRSGIFMWSSWSCRTEIGETCSPGPDWAPKPFTPWTNFVVRNNLVYDTGGDGIVALVTDHALLEYNTVHDANVRCSNVQGKKWNVGMWAWNADYSNFQYNEAYLVRTTNDGQGFDIDYGQIGTLFQYNYSHDNEGGFILICNDGTISGNTNRDAIVRYNISQNDKARIFQVHGPVQNIQIYNNTVFTASGLNVALVDFGNPGWGQPVSVFYWNNIFYHAGTGAFTYNLPPNQTFDYNVFYVASGTHTGEPTDAHKLTSNPLLVNPGSGGTGRTTVGGYQLQGGSPAIGSGMVVANNGGLDYWGNAVSSFCPPDRGAHQYSGTGCSTPTPTKTPTVGPTPTPTNTPVPAQNMVQNPGFETGTLSPWTTSGGSIITSPVHSGSYAFQVVGSKKTLEQVVTGLLPNTTYNYSGWAMVATAGTTVDIGVKDFNGSLVVKQGVTGTSYTQVNLVFTTGATNTTAKIYCYKISGSANANCDDFSITRQ